MLGLGLSLSLGSRGGGGAAAVINTRVATVGGAVPFGGTSALSAVTKRRIRTQNPIMLTNSTARARIIMPGHQLDNSNAEQTISWSGVTAMAIQVAICNSSLTQSGSLFRAKVGGLDSWVPAAGDVTTDWFSPSDLGLANWGTGLYMTTMWETDAASGTVFPMTYGPGSSGDSGDGSFDGGTTSLGVYSFAANGGSNSGTRICRPLMIQFEHTGACIGYIGDSRPNGKGNQPSGYGLIRGGYAFQAAKQAGKPIIKLTGDGDSLALWNAGSTWRRSLLPGITDLYIDLGFNDINSVDAATTQARYTALLDSLDAVNPTARKHAVAIGLRTNSTSTNWLAPPDQTPMAEYVNSSGTRRFDVNAWLTGLVGTRLTSVLNLVPDYYYDVSNQDVYWSDGTNKKVTADGAHFTAFGEARVGSNTSILYNHMVANVV